jgi:uncharacterized lipoprotein
LGLAFALIGCETVARLFPDKQKQYQYSSEIPPLEVPPDLSSSTIDEAVRKKETETGEAPSDEQPSAAEKAAAADESKPAASAPSKRRRSSATPTLAQSSDNIPLIEIDGSFEVAWVAVAKALSRMELEISDQNRSDGVYYVYYGSDRKPYEDRGFLGDLAELLGSASEPAREYRVKVESRAATTCLVYVLDTENKPQTEGAGLDLLKRLNDALKPASPAESGGSS